MRRAAIYQTGFLLFLAVRAAGQTNVPTKAFADGVAQIDITLPDSAVLALAPSDAFFVAYLSNIAGNGERPVIEFLRAESPGALALLDSWQAISSGSLMVALSGMPVNPLSWRLTVASRCRANHSVLRSFLASELAPAWNASELGQSVGKMEVFSVGGTSRITVVGRFSFFLTLAVRDNLMFASNRPGETDRWLAGGTIGTSFVGASDYQRLTEAMKNAPTNLAYLDLRTLMPLQVSSLETQLAGLPAALQLASVEWIGLATDSATRPANRQADGVEESVDGRLRAPRMRVTIGFSEQPTGLWHLLASKPMPPTLAGWFPESCDMFVAGGMESEARIVDDVFTFLGKIDPAIVQEYAEDRKDFESEVGFDFQTDLQANLVDSWAWGASGLSMGSAMIAIRVRDVALLNSHLSQLRSVFRLEEEQNSYRGIPIHTVVHAATPFSYAIAGDVLLLAPTTLDIRRGIGSFLDGSGLDRTDSFIDALRALGPRASKYVYVNIGSIFSQLLEKEPADVPEPIVAWINRMRAIGLAVQPGDRMISLDVATADGRPSNVVDLVLMTVIPSLQRARYLSHRAVSASNIKAILIACKVYGADHKNQWPATLAEVVRSGLLGTPEDAARLLANPYDTHASRSKVYYLYRPVDEAAVEDPAQTPAVSEPRIVDGGCNFGFVDGHVEWVESPRAEQLLAMMR